MPLFDESTCTPLPAALLCALKVGGGLGCGFGTVRGGLCLLVYVSTAAESPSPARCLALVPYSESNGQACKPSPTHKQLIIGMPRLVLASPYLQVGRVRCINVRKCCSRIKIAGLQHCWEVSVMRKSATGVQLLVEKPCTITTVPSFLFSLQMPPFRAITRDLSGVS
jgi:hypothetical protein